MSNKRKASEAQLDANSIDMSSMDEQGLSEFLLSLLPKDATKHHEQVKKLSNAYHMAMEKINNRTNEEEEESAPNEDGANDEEPVVVLGNVNMPQGPFHHILTYLDRCALMHKVSYVCKAWSSEARHPSFWTLLNFQMGLSLDCSVPIPEFITQVLKRPQFRDLKTLVLPSDIRQPRMLVPCPVVDLSENCPNLEKLVFAGNFNPTSNSILAEIATRLTMLKKVQFSTDYVTGAGVVAMATIMGDRLNHLSVLIKGKMLTDEAIEMIASSCPNLEHFQVSMHLCAPTHSSISDVLTERVIIQLIHRCRHLKSLAVLNLSEECPNLEELDSGFCIWSYFTIGPTPTNSILAEIATRLTSLKKVKLNTKSATSAGIVAMATIMGDRLTHLSVRITDNMLPDEAIESIASSCPNLEHFEVCMPYSSVSDEVTERGIIQLIHKCRRLKSLAISDARHVGLPAFELIAQGESSLTELRVLNIPCLIGKYSLYNLLDEKLEEFHIGYTRLPCRRVKRVSG